MKIFRESGDWSSAKKTEEFPTFQEMEKNIFFNWWMSMAVTMESAVLMGKNFQNNQNSIVNTADLTKQMFDISEKLVAEQDEISSLETNW